MRELLGQVKIDDGPYEFEIKEIAKCNGEAMASNRKNRLITYWDYELELKYRVNRKDKNIEAADYRSFS